jgi:hypothetical protein
MEAAPHVRSVVGLDAIRALRVEVMAMAEAAHRDPKARQLLCLVSPRMTEERIGEEWRLMGRILRPEVVRRLSIHVVHADGRGRSFGDIPASIAANLCRAGGRREPGAGAVRLPAPDYSFIILKLFVYAWLTHRGPVTARWLGDTAGCSYPTVASATRRLGRAISRRRDRRLELRELPRQEWSRVLTLAEDARSTMRFADRAGQPRTASSLAERLQHLRPKGVAIGGVLGARHHDPELDLMGLPRLDVSVFSPGREADIAFVRQIDPALEATSDPAEPARLVVHFVRHREPLFEADAGGLPWADPVECLLDLHEARLEPQAAQFVRAVRARGQEVR